jgi:exonuclease III
VIYSGSERKYEAGVAMVLSRNIAGYDPINKRLLTVRLAGKPMNVTMIQVYAPTNQAPESEKEEFYSSLQIAVNSVRKQDMVLINGDFNAKIGSGAVNSHGKFAIGQQNDNGERLIQFAQSNGLRAANAWVSRHPRHLYTWRSPDGVHRNQIEVEVRLRNRFELLALPSEDFADEEE